MRRDRLAAELAEELAFHYERRLADHLDRGLDPRSAHALSRRQLGNLALATEDCRDMWSFMRLERLAQDLRHACRMYARTPVFTGVCVLSIALGIGGNAAILSLVNALLVRPLPYDQPERLVRVTGIYPRAAIPFFQSRSRAMEIAAVSPGIELNLTGDGPAVRLVGTVATPNFLSVLGTPLALGRTFLPGEESPGRDGVVIISHSLWKERYGADPSVLGRVIQLSGVNREIVGIMPATFSYPSATVKCWLPMRIDPSNFLEYWGTQFMPLLGRLRPAAAIAEAQSEVRSLTSEFRQTFPYPMAADFNATSTAIPLQQDIVGNVRDRLLILLASVATVLLIACANVASMLLSRATARRREIAIRTALGAGRARIVRQLLTESVGLAAAGAALGILLGLSALSLFKSVLPASMPGVADARIDWPIVVGITMLGLLSGLTSGLAPALSASQADLADAMRTGSSRSMSRLWNRVRGGFIASEVALTLMLLVSAGLLLKSIYALSIVHPGFEREGVLTVRISPIQSACMQRSACIALYNRLLARAEAIPGVEAAALSNSVPLDGRVPSVPVDLEGHPKTADNPAPLFWFGAVSPGYHRMMRMSLFAGRYFTESDVAGAEPVAMVDVSTVRRFWSTEGAIGKHIRPAGSQTWRTIVGVVGDAQYFRLGQGLPTGFGGTVYMPYSQSELANGQIPAAMTLLGKLDSSSARTAHQLEELARDQDTNIPVSPVQALTEVVAQSTSEMQSTVLVFISFAGAAIVLAAVGIYGLMSYWVSQRTYEIGLRLAVGCTRHGILSMILTQGLRLTLLGVTAGIVGASVVTRYLSTQLYGVGARDLATFVIVTSVLFVVALLAMAFPAWRATRIDPVIALKAD